jgi:ribosomal protein S18 acetylase RimI-like enzyme
MALDATIRTATAADLPALGRLGALLMRAHHQFDAQRFMDPGTDPAQGYAWFLGRQLKDHDVVIFVAEQNGEVIGYVYAGIEPISWKELRDECGFIHDVVVDERGRRSGTATALIEKAVEWLHERGVPRVMLWTAEQNTGAQQLFAKLGFRRTMIEMTREL